MKFVLILLFCAGASWLSAQQAGIALEVIGSAGGFEKSTGQGSVSYTVGEVVTEYAETNQGSASQGFQQVFEALLVSKIKPLQASIRVFPNPTLNQINVQGAESMDLQLYDLNGRLLLERSDLTANELLDLSELAQGPYLLRFSNSATNQHKTVRLIKQ